MTNKPFHGKVIYNPSGKAGEYSYWAANFYNGCSSRCEYCYNRHGRSAKILGCDIPTLKKSLIDEDTAYAIFEKEMKWNLHELKNHGLFFNFVSDPFLKETILLNTSAMRECICYGIPVKALTKQTWWVDGFLKEVNINGTFWNLIIEKYQKYFSIGFTLTGHDELESAAATNHERIEAMKKLHDAGFKTWASIEPIIDLPTSFRMIQETNGICDFYKIGLQSGKKYLKTELRTFLTAIIEQVYFMQTPVYLKDSFIKQVGIERKDLPPNFVTREFNL